MHRSLVPVCLCALCAGAATTDPKPDLLTLARIKTVMTETLARQPNYTCIQQVERSRRRLPKRRFQLHDVLRLEVALVDGKEMFAWPGSRRFEQTDLTEMIADGAIGTGDFALHARAVFHSSAPVFKYAGQSEMRGRQVERFDFSVTRLNSGYHIKSPGHEAVVGYHGSLWADVASQELVRLEVNADNIPEELGISAARDVMDYDRMKIGASEFLLPSASELTMTDLAGNESRNRTQFKACRQYTGESIVTFDAPPPDENASAAQNVESAAAQTVELPPGSVLEAHLASGIDSNSAVGDPIQAVLDQKLKIKHGLSLDKGTKLSGRILRLEIQGEYTLLNLQFSEIEQHAGRSPVLARLDELLLPMTNMQMRASVLPVDPRHPGEGVRLRGNSIRLYPGSRVRLRTFAR